jgi:hypothetical protein
MTESTIKIRLMKADDLFSPSKTIHLERRL